MENTSSSKLPEIFADETIRNHPIFAGLSERCLREISVQFVVEKIEEGEKFTYSDKWLLVVRGSLEITDSNLSKKPESAILLLAGKSAGEINLIESGHSEIKATAQEDTEILTLSSKIFGTMINKKSIHTNNFYFNLTKCLCMKLKELNNEYAELYIQQLLQQNTPK